MSQPYNLSQIQRRTYQMISFEDGLYDLLLGITFMFLAIYPVTRELLGPTWNFVLFLSLLALTIVAQLLVRHLVSQPRIGYVRLRKTLTLRVLFIIGVVMVVITFGLVLLTLLSPGLEPTSSVPAEAPGERSYLVEFITLLFMGGLLSAMGYVFGVRRLYFYGWMVGLAYLASVYMEHNAGWILLIPMAFAAGVILVTGFVLFLRFLRKYPLPAEEA
jgi:hypothetical protein